jgi:signal transduction histidine kinase
MPPEIPTPEAEAAERAAEFLAIFAHELRTPLTSLRVALQVLERGAPEEQRQELIAASRRSVERLIVRLGHAIEATALALGHLRLVRESVDVAAALERAVAEARVRLGREDLAVDDVGAGLPRVDADSNRLHQVLAELLDNAGRATPAGGGIAVGARAEGEGVSITVSDGGPGIPAHERRDVFRPFHQIDRSITRQGSGLGLGLAVCRGLVEAHGGRIFVEAGPASAVTFTMPAVRTDAPALDLDLHQVPPASAP